MNLDPVLLSRLQFAITIGFHFIFPSISIGLAWILVIVEWMGWKRKDSDYDNLGKFLGKIFALTFAVGVATGIVMEFQFGTNWAEYSKFVGDIFGAPLAAEGIFAFFLESTFLGLFLFGRNRVPRRIHWFSALMVGIGATISAFWIIVANSWQQTPAGFIFNPETGRAELLNFRDAVFNPSTFPRYFHTVDSSITTAAFFVAGISAFLILKNRNNTIARKSLALSLIIGLVSSITVLFPFGHYHAKQVALTQPAKFAAIEGLYETQEKAPLTVIAIHTGDPDTPPPGIRIPSLLSYFVYDDANAEVEGLDAFPADELPPFPLTFYSFHLMFLMGMGFIGMSLLGFLLYRMKKLWKAGWFLKLLILASPFPVIACQLGWITAEVGRQPWVVYKLLRTSDAISLTVSPSELLFSLIMFSLLYIILLILYLFILFREIKHGPGLDNLKEAAG
jgi:cytochrome d ubiquinol oxidase subunit I